MLTAIDRHSAVRASNASDEKKLNALKYMVDLVGDVYQPHAGYLHDKGGNQYQLQAFMRGSNLHALGDDSLSVVQAHLQLRQSVLFFEFAFFKNRRILNSQQQPTGQPPVKPSNPTNNLT